MSEILKAQATQFPQRPGVYRFYDRDGSVLYVGKAKNLRKRLLQYFGHDKRAQLPYLLNDSSKIDFTITTNELEALYLETTLIQKYLPKYNIDLRDDKNFAYIKIDYESEIPQITYVRQVNKKSHAKYFGPYSAAYKIRRLLEFLRKHIGFCQNKRLKDRPCFYYHLHRCPGICAGKISREEYLEHLRLIEQYLKGDKKPLITKLKRKMKTAVKYLNFESAQEIKEQLDNIEVLGEEQLAVLPSKVAWDMWGIATAGTTTCFYLVKVRQGRIYDTDAFYEKDGEALDLVEKFLTTYYLEATDIPKNIFLPKELAESDLLTQIIEEQKRVKIKISVPIFGTKKDLLRMAQANADIFVKKKEIGEIKKQYNAQEVLLSLQTLLALPTVPNRIECYDISNTQGTNPVASMVVMTNGLPDKSQYRKFKINVKDTPDDFSMMREVLKRRLKYLLLQNDDNKFALKPDLIVIDGGKGQLSAAIQAQSDTFSLFHSSSFSPIPMIGLAKRIEEIFVPNNKDPITLPHNSPTLQILQRIRDEAHRFGIGYHRDLRSKQATASPLDNIKGLGPKTIKLLKSKYGTKKAAQEAPLEELESLIGKHKAYLIKQK